MTSSELDELELVAHMARNDMSGHARVGVAKLQALIAIARCAEGLAESVEAMLYEHDEGQACAQARRELEGYRKAGRP